MNNKVGYALFIVITVIYVLTGCFLVTNHKPSVDLSDIPGQFNLNGLDDTITLTLVLSDPDGDPLTYRVYADASLVAYTDPRDPVKLDSDNKKVVHVSVKAKDMTDELGKRVNIKVVAADPKQTKDEQSKSVYLNMIPKLLLISPLDGTIVNSSEKFTWKGIDTDDDIGNLRYTLYVKKEVESDWGEGITSESTGIVISSVLSHMEPHTEYQWKVKGCDERGACGESDTWSFGTENTEPEVIMFIGDATNVAVGEYKVPFRVKDKDGDSLEATVSVYEIEGEEERLIKVYGYTGEGEIAGEASFDVEADKEYHVKLEVDDGNGGELTREAKIVATRSPIIITITPNNGGEITIYDSISWVASDPDKDSLSYEVYIKEQGGETWKKIYEGTINSAKVKGFVKGHRTYLWKLIVNDNKGAMNSTVNTFYVKNNNPELMLLEPLQGSSKIMVSPDDPVVSVRVHVKEYDGDYPVTLKLFQNDEEKGVKQATQEDDYEFKVPVELYKTYVWRIEAEENYNEGLTSTIKTDEYKVEPVEMAEESYKIIKEESMLIVYGRYTGFVGFEIKITSSKPYTVSDLESIEVKNGAKHVIKTVVNGEILVSAIYDKMDVYGELLKFSDVHADSEVAVKILEEKRFLVKPENNEIFGNMNKNKLRDVEFEWEPICEQCRYYLYVSTNREDIESLSVLPVIGDITSTSVYLNVSRYVELDQVGTVYWLVEAVGKDKIVYSEIRSFSLPELVDFAVFPKGEVNAIMYTNFQWSKVCDDCSYDLYISNSMEEIENIDSIQPVVSGISATSVNIVVHLLEDSGENLYWRVVARSRDGSVVSDIEEFKTSESTESFEDRELSSYIVSGRWNFSSVSHSGNYSLHAWSDSCELYDSSLEVNVIFPKDGVVEFWYRINNEYNNLTFTFYVDGVSKFNVFSNEDKDSGWVKVTVPVGAGKHTLKWYVDDKDYYDSFDLYIDDIVIDKAE